MKCPGISPNNTIGSFASRWTLKNGLVVKADRKAQSSYLDMRGYWVASASGASRNPDVRITVDSAMNIGIDPFAYLPRQKLTNCFIRTLSYLLSSPVWVRGGKDDAIHGMVCLLVKIIDTFWSHSRHAFSTFPSVSSTFVVSSKVQWSVSDIANLSLLVLSSPQTMTRSSHDR